MKIILARVCVLVLFSLALSRNALSALSALSHGFYLAAIICTIVNFLNRKA
jgi:tetrahydromethanopterin S-methyltransferase subunit C